MAQFSPNSQLVPGIVVNVLFVFFVFIWNKINAHSSMDEPVRESMWKHVGKCCAGVCWDSPFTFACMLQVLFTGRALPTPCYRHARFTSALINRTHLSALSTANSTFASAHALTKKEKNAKWEGTKTGSRRKPRVFCAELKIFYLHYREMFHSCAKLFIKLRLMRWLPSRHEVNLSISRQQSSASDLSTKNSYTELKHTKAYTDTTKKKNINP